MNPTRRAPAPSGRLRNLIVAACLAALMFLSTLRFGLPTAATGLDSSWKEVLGWAWLQNAQWGCDLIFTYGPTGFLYPLANYFDGIFWPFVVGQVVLTAAFSLISVVVVSRGGLVCGLAFAVAFCAWNVLVPGEISWPLTLLFGTSLLLDTGKQRIDWQWVGLASCIALVFGLIACSKFSLFPIWLLCVLSMATCIASGESLRRGAGVLCLFVGAIPVVWFASSQGFGNLFDFVVNGSEVASGYGHAMGFSAPLRMEFAAFGCLTAFAFLSSLVIWKVRREPTRILVPMLYAITAFWAWRAHFTRGDHAPYFFALIALLPYGLICSRSVAHPRIVKLGMLLLSLACVSASFVSSAYGPPAKRIAQFVDVVRDNVQSLAHLRDLHAQRIAEWNQAKQQAALPEISRRVGSSRIDMVGVEQGALLLNGLNYAPRPVFQSYSAYTPYLAKLNESYFLGPQAPDFAVLKVAPIDGRLPMGEDGLALLALLRRYQPVVSENGFLLLQRMGLVAPQPVALPQSWTEVSLGQDVRIQEGGRAVVAFVRLNLTTVGRLFSLFLREPALTITLGTNRGPQSYRFIRATGASGFVISPSMQSGFEWLGFYAGMPTIRVDSFRIEPSEPWQKMLFAPTFQFGSESMEIPRLDAPAHALDEILPGFSDIPTSVQGINEAVVEGDRRALMLHAPGTIEFRPLPGKYEISASFGIRNAALTDSNCAAAHPDGVGITVVVRHADGMETLLLHRELDPFHVLMDRGAQRLAIGDVKIADDDSVDYRVDPGHGGSNTACDWSYVRDLSFNKIAPNPVN